MTRPLPELLAPAGSQEALESACAAGADAVYLGASRFGARASAGFDEPALEAAIDFAHTHDVRVYVTLNTLITERELAPVADELLAVYSAGADALLVQDLGVASLARELVPRLALHASTQMTVHSADGARAAMRLGCSRVVLARELSLGEVEAIAANVPGIELEVFAHGALCYGWSGQCLFSSAIGGRSGNRGRCAQPCRKPYHLLAGDVDKWGRITAPRKVPLQDEYLLSPRDLWTYPKIERLAQAPIAALKIEGRLRSPSYVATVVGSYRRALDLVAEGAFEPDPSTVEALSLTYNREFTRGRLFGENDAAVMGRDRPGPRGVRIGTVTGLDRTGRTMIRLDRAVRPRKGDGLVLAPRGRPAKDLGVILRRDADESVLTLSLGSPIAEGTPVFLTSRGTELNTRADAVVEISLSLQVDESGRPIFSGAVHRRRLSPLRFEGSGEPFLPARSRPLDAETLEVHLRRTGGTPYRFTSIEVDIRGEYFAPASILNELRRQVLKAVSLVLLKAGRPPADEVLEANRRRTARLLPVEGFPSVRPLFTPHLRIIVDSVEAAREATRAGVDEVCLEIAGRPRSTCVCTALGSEDLLDLLRTALMACGNVPLIWKWPRITRQSFLDEALPVLEKAPIAGLLVDGLGAAEAALTTVPGIPIHGGQGINLWNSQTAVTLAPQFASLTLSPELSEHEIRDVVGASRAVGVRISFVLQVQGSLEVLITEDCVQSLAGCPPSKGTRFVLEDDSHHRFPVLPDSGGRTRILNAVETCLIDNLPAIASAGVQGVVIDARGRTPAYAAEATETYRLALAYLSLPRNERPVLLETLRKRLVPIAAGGITAGLFSRGRREEQQLLPGSEHGNPCQRSSS